MLWEGFNPVSCVDCDKKPNIKNCYGEEMWLVYDYNGDVSERGKRNIRALIERCIKLKKQVALQGITFELILIDDLLEYINTIR